MQFRLQKNKKKKRTSALGQRRRKLLKIKIVVAAVTAILLIVLLGWMMRLEQLQLQEINVTGNSVTKTEDIVSIIEETLSGTYFFISPKRNALVYPKETIEEEISKQFPRISKVSAERRDFTSLIVTIEEYEPFALWCGRMYVDTDDNLGNCYFINDESYVFAKAPDFTGNIFFQYFGMLEEQIGTGSSTIIGGQYMNELDFAGLQLFLEAFSELPFIPASLYRVDEKDFELRLASGTVIKFGRDMDLSVVLDNLQSILESEQLLLDEQELEYIDLRFGNRVYYRFVDESEVENNISFPTSTDTIQ